MLVLGIALGHGGLTHWGVGAVAATYVASVVLRPEAMDQSGVIVAVALLGSAELSAWAIDSRRRGLDDAVVHLHRLRGIALVTAVGIALAATVEGAANFGSGGSVAAALASAAVVAAVVVTCLLVWKGRRIENQDTAQRT